VPHVVQQVMSSESTPILAGVIPAFEAFMSRWEELAKEEPRLCIFVEEGLTWARKYYQRMDHTIAFVVAMRVSPFG
jgi:hypothetical protein